MIHANLMALSFIEPKLCATEVYIVGIRILDVFGSCDLAFNPMTFIYELDSHCLDIRLMCKYEPSRAVY